MNTTITVDDVYDALGALPGAQPDPHRTGSSDVALAAATTDPTMIETWVLARVFWLRRDRPTAVFVSATVTFADDEISGWMAAYSDVPVTDCGTAVDAAAAAQGLAEELVAMVNEGARLARDGRLAEAVQYAQAHRIAFHPAAVSA
ncbi:hypothetical protein [Mycobacteroides abscessus]|uniref:hypothetical protein n=1 Tax=Mycobacteroides abscessus TaxID=36809 RepID=UPI0019D2F795|nr:hypothetical protein [Mycobacteroides abscessus]MBN7296583.1 hypothetical protein [Mycobacteroides abscessus subsp. abscessus]